MIHIAFILSVMILWLLSGQMIKGLRRYAIPLIATAYVALLKDRKLRWMASIMLVLSAILSLGYGENSHIRKSLGGSDFWTRIVMAILVASVPITYGFMTDMAWYKAVIMLVLNLSAWQVHAGSLCKIGKYDVLIEDMYRSFALGLSIVIM